MLVEFNGVPKKFIIDTKYIWYIRQLRGEYSIHKNDGFLWITNSYDEIIRKLPKEEFVEFKDINNNDIIINRNVIGELHYYLENKSDIYINGDINDSIVITDDYNIIKTKLGIK